MAQALNASSLWRARVRLAIDITRCHYHPSTTERHWRRTASLAALPASSTRDDRGW